MLSKRVSVEQNFSLSCILYLYTHAHCSPDLANLQCLILEHINRPTECKVAFHVFTIRTYTFPEWEGRICTYIYKYIYSNSYLLLWLALKIWLILKMFNFMIWINLPFLQIFGHMELSQTGWHIVIQGQIYLEVNSAQQSINQDVLVYGDFNLQKWWEASGPALISNWKAICFTEVYFKAKIMGELLGKYLQIF